MECRLGSSHAPTDCLLPITYCRLAPPGASPLPIERSTSSAARPQRARVSDLCRPAPWPLTLVDLGAVYGRHGPRRITRFFFLHGKIAGIRKPPAASAFSVQNFFRRSVGKGARSG